jgi:superfamily II DNA/RNA helicase
MDMLKQSQELSKIPHIIVGTPGRVNDMMNRDFKLRDYIGNLKFLVLDEADRLFEESMLIDLREVYLFFVRFFKWKIRLLEDYQKKDKIF